MAGCLRCGASIDVGTLCDQHRAELATCGDITAEQIQAQDPEDSAAWLIDQWGCTHPVGRRFTVGRSGDCSLSVAHHSVSALHAELAVREGGAILRDLGSLNGTRVNGDTMTGGRVFDGDRLQFGDVSLYFVERDLPRVGAEPGTGRTVPTQRDAIAFTGRVQAGAMSIDLAEREGGGVAVAGGQEIDLGRLEFDLLKVVAMRRLDRREPARMYVSSSELARTLEFNSVAADGENVRELVRRVRKKLRAAGLPDLLESRKGAGYRLAWPIKPIEPSR